MSTKLIRYKFLVLLNVNKCIGNETLANLIVNLLLNKMVIICFHKYYDLSELPYPSFMSKKLCDVNVGSMTNVCVVNQNCPVHKALQYFIEYGVSALPVVDQDGQLIDIYAKFDVIVNGVWQSTTVNLCSVLIIIP
ncbi:unnamed protein product [Schistosoma margrebowiei]|uniref:CBS domain-containing protein n=1 Tax=Schistosoma margrebowiei TaxID=48269 RepID=A0A3P7VXM5_9TREM|nr:unnamed protein product [Schistosoma margrebowiei]